MLGGNVLARLVATRTLPPSFKLRSCLLLLFFLLFLPTRL